MIYFDNAATGGEKPAPVVTAVAAALRVCANPGRSGHALSVACAKNVLRTRETLAGLFDAPDPERVIFTQNCTEALNIFIFGTLKRGDHVITTPLEHNSVLRPLERLKTQGIIDYDVCPIENGNVTPEGIASLVRENTALVIVTAASNVTGKMPPLAEIRKALPERILFLCDGAQGAGHIPLSMEKYGLDGLCIAGHKVLFAMQGSVVLLFSKRVNPAPLCYGGTGSESFSLSMPDFYPDALEAGTQSYPAIVSRRITLRTADSPCPRHAGKRIGTGEFFAFQQKMAGGSAARFFARSCRSETPSLTLFAFFPRFSERVFCLISALLLSAAGSAPFSKSA